MENKNVLVGKNCHVCQHQTWTICGVDCEKCVDIEEIKNFCKKFELQEWLKPENETKQYIGLNDCNGDQIFKGCTLEGFDRTFKVQYGIVNVEKVSPNKKINEVQIPCFYFEDIENKEKLFPILKNYKGTNDLEDLKIINMRQTTINMGQPVKKGDE